MYDFFRTNPGYKNNFKERHDYMENGTRVQVTAYTLSVGITTSIGFDFLSCAQIFQLFVSE